MGRILVIAFVLLWICTAPAQNKQLLVKKELFTGQADYPYFKRFNWIDSVNVYSVTYLSDGLKVNGFLAMPKKAGKYPAIISNRGGNLEFGQWDIRSFYAQCGILAKEGYVVIASQYRGNDGGEGKEEFGGSDVNDVLNIIEVLPEIKEADTSRIGMYGWSRGGMMTYMALAHTKKIKAAAVGGGLSDLHASIADRADMEQVYEKLIPNYKSQKKTELDKRSAIQWVDKFPKNVPILLLHGTADWRVKSEQTLKLALEFEKYRIPYRLIMFEGADHGINEHKNEVNRQVVDWFNRFLKNSEAVPEMKYHGG